MNPFNILTERITTRMAELSIPGAAVGVWHRAIEQAAGFGVTSAAHPLPVSAETLFQVGSITKTILATAALRLVEQGQLELDRPVRAYLPGLRLSDEATAAALTLRHLLTHTGGWAGDYFNSFGWGDDALERMVASLARLPQLTPLGSLWHYNNAGFAIAGRLVELAAGRPFEAAIQELMFDPLGMKMAYFFPQDVMVHSFAVGHVGEAGQAPQAALPWAVGRSNHPAGGVVSNVLDLLRYARFHLRDGVTEDGLRWLSSASIAEMRRPQVQPGPSADAMGLTWFIKTIGGVTIFRHGGSTHGQNAQFLFAPGHDFAFALLTNHDNGDALGMELYRAVLEIYLGVVEPEPQVFKLPENELAEFAGQYEAQSQSIEITPQDGGLHFQTHNHGGFPTPETPPQPDPKPFSAVFYEPDRVIVREGQEKGTRAEFLRDSQKQIAWLRLGGRIHKRTG